MKLGVLSSIYWECSFEEVIDDVAKNGLEGVEIACWPKDQGVSHIDVENTDPSYIAYIKGYCDKNNVKISSLGFYPNNMDPDENIRSFNINHLKKVIHMSSLLGVNLVTTFIGKDQYKTDEENLKNLEKVWAPIIRFAEQEKVKIAIENCPFLFSIDQWPGGTNLFSSPIIWRKVFSILNSDIIGINFDPSHLIYQQIDYIKPVYEFKDKIFHVHLKDMKIYRDKLSECGIHALPNDYITPKLPGLGDINWPSFISALNDIDYNGFACIEVEDKAYSQNKERIKASVTQSTHYLRQFIM